MGLRSGLSAGQSLINAMVIRAEEIHSVPSCMVRDIILVKKIDIGIILKQSDNVREFISVALGIQIPFDTDEISAKAMCNARPHQDRPPAPPPPNDLVQVCKSRHNVHFSYGIFDPCHHLDER